MRSIKNILYTVLLLSFLSGCGKNEEKAPESKSGEKNKEATSNSQSTSNAGNQGDPDKSETVIIELPTMQCNMCKKNIESAVNTVDGVNEVVVDVKEKVARINYVKSKSDLNKLEGAIVMAGYQANDQPANKEAYDKLEKCCKVGGHD